MSIFEVMSKNKLKKFHNKINKNEKIYKLGSFDLYSKSEINSNIESIEDNIAYKFSTKTKSLISNFFEENEIKKTFQGSNSRSELIKKMANNYEKTSLKQLNFFIDNVAFKYNQHTNKPLINWSNNISLYNSLKKNFTLKFDNQNNIYYELEKEKIKGEFLTNIDKKYSAKKMAKVYCLEEYIKDENEEYVKLFLTFTNVSEFHYYTLKDKKDLDTEAIDEEEIGSKKFIKNPKYNSDLGSFENSIVEGMKKQKEINKHFYKDLKKKIERAELNSNIYHFTIFEPHKSLQPHSHKMLILPASCIDLAYESFENTKKHFGLNQVKIEEINEAKASTYITKYLMKTLRQDDKLNIDFESNKNDYFCEEEAKQELIAEAKNENFLKDNFFNIYRRYFGAKNRIFTSSNFKTTTQKKIDIMYKYLKENHKEFLKSLKATGKSLYYQLEKLEEEKIFIFEKDKKLTFVFDTDLLKQEYERYFKEEKKKLFKILKDTMRTIYRENKDIDMSFLKLSKSEERILLAQRLIALHNIKLNLDIPLTLKYLLNYCSIKARKRILSEIKLDTLNLSNNTDLSHLDLKNFAQKDLTKLVKNVILESVEKTKYLTTSENKYIKNAYFNNSYDITSKKHNESINIYKDNMYKDLKDDFVNLEEKLLCYIDF